jgi:hypothetical protein
MLAYILGLLVGLVFKARTTNSVYLRHLRTYMILYMYCVLIVFII